MWSDLAGEALLYLQRAPVHSNVNAPPDHTCLARERFRRGSMHTGAMLRRLAMSVSDNRVSAATAVGKPPCFKSGIAYKSVLFRLARRIAWFNSPP
jgi:hypothetical protein